MQEPPPVRCWAHRNILILQAGRFLNKVHVGPWAAAVGGQQQPRSTPAGVCGAPPPMLLRARPAGSQPPAPERAVHVRCRPLAAAWGAEKPVQEWLLQNPPPWSSQFSVLWQGQAQAARGQPPRMTHGPPPPALTQRGGRCQAGGRFGGGAQSRLFLPPPSQQRRGPAFRVWACPQRCHQCAALPWQVSHTNPRQDLPSPVTRTQDPEDHPLPTQNSITSPRRVQLK